MQTPCSTNNYIPPGIFPQWHTASGGCYIKTVITGIDKAWALITEKGPEGIIRDACVGYDAREDCYRMLSLGMLFMLCPGRRSIRGMSEEAHDFYNEQSLYFEHSVLWYLAESMGAGRTGRLIKPSTLRGDHHFFTRGTHKLPLDELAAVYGADPGAFLARGRKLGGTESDIGEVAVELLPMPMVPVVITLWLADDEFPPRCDLFFDSSAEYHAPLDALWATAMLAVKAMM